MGEDTEKKLNQKHKQKQKHKKAPDSSNPTFEFKPLSDPTKKLQPPITDAFGDCMVKAKCFFKDSGSTSPGSKMAQSLRDPSSATSGTKPFAVKAGGARITSLSPIESDSAASARSSRILSSASRDRRNFHDQVYFHNNLQATDSDYTSSYYHEYQAENNKQPATSFSKPSLVPIVSFVPFKLDLSNVLKPIRESASVETHVFTFNLAFSSVSSYVILYPYPSDIGYEDGGGGGDFQRGLIDLLSSCVDMATVDKLLSVVNSVMEERGKEWYNVDIKAWLDPGEYRPPVRVCKGDPCIKVLFTIARVRDFALEDHAREFEKIRQYSSRSPGKSYGLDSTEVGE